MAGGAPGSEVDALDVGDSKSMTLGGVPGGCGACWAVARCAGRSAKSRKQDITRRPSGVCSPWIPRLARCSSLKVCAPCWLIQGHYQPCTLAHGTLRHRHTDGLRAALEASAEHGFVLQTSGCSRCPLECQVRAVSKKDAAIARPREVGYRNRFNHREDFGLIALQTCNWLIAFALHE